MSVEAEKEEGFDFSRMVAKDVEARRLAAALRGFHERRVSAALLIAAEKLEEMAELLREANVTILALRAKRRD